MKKLSVFPIVALMLAVAASAFTSTKKTTTQWLFEGTQLNQARMPEQYTQNIGSPSCAGLNLPCIIDVPDDPTRSDEEDLEAYLAGFASDQAVVNDATSRKN